ncbi:MAG: WD40 repeat domain-containing protein [Chloroflexi bacterium]|nr:WD40 repeat domain-containing protein [Chloroflexota bacterium]
MKRLTFHIIFAILLVACTPGSKSPRSNTEFSPTPTFSPTAPIPTATPRSLVISPANASDVSELARLGKGIIKQILWSPDGKNIAVATSIGVYFYDASSYSEILYIDTGSQVTSIAYSPDGKMLATSNDYPAKNIKLWDIASGKLIRTLGADLPLINSIAINKKDSILAAGGAGGKISFWNIQTGESIEVMDADGRRIESITFNNSGDMLASGGRDGIIQLWNLGKGELIKTLVAPGEFAVMALTFSPTNTYLASSGNDGKVTLWDIDKGKILFSGQSDRTTSLSFSPDGAMLASANDDSKVRVWNIPNGKLAYTLTDHTNAVTAVSYSPDGKTLVSGSEDGTLRFWDGKSGKHLQTLDGFSNYILDIALNFNGKTILSSGWQGVDVWDVETLQVIKRINIGTDWQESVSFSPNGEYSASLGCAEVDNFGYCQRSNALIWDSRSFATIQTIDVGENSTDPVKVLFSPDGKFFITADGRTETQATKETKNIKVWDIKTGELITVIGNLFVSDIIFNTVRDELIVGGLDQIIGIDFIAGRQNYTITAGKFLQLSVDYLAISPDGETLVVGEMTGNAEGVISIWDMSTKAEKQTISHGKARAAIPQIDSLVFSPNGLLLASGASDGTIYLWDTYSWKRVAVLRHTDIVSKVIFSDDGKFLISSSFDGTIRIWGIQP